MNLSLRRNSIISRAISFSLLVTFAFMNQTVVNANLNRGSANDERTFASTHFVTDLTQLGRDGRLRQNLSLEADVLRLERILGGQNERSPILIDHANEGAELVIEQLALRLASGDAAAGLAGIAIFKIEANAIFGRASSENAAVTAFASELANVRAKHTRSIVFIDDMRI